jgi:hypothetical protein
MRRAGTRSRGATVLLGALAIAFLAAPSVPSAPGAPDFQLTVSPAAQTLPPGSSVSFSIGVAATDGFAQPVTLSVDGLPAGVTASFSANPVTPSGGSFLKLSAAASTPTGVFSVTVTGTGGGITHTASGRVTVDFGLIPICQGAVEGIVTDRETGESLAGVDIFTGNPVVPDATTGPDGRYRIEHLPLGENNSPQQFGLHPAKDGYWSHDALGVAVCNETTRLDISIVRIEPYRISGQIVEGVPDPTDHSKVTPTSTPIRSAGAQVFGLVPDFSTPPSVTGADGRYDITFHNFDNKPLVNSVLHVYDTLHGELDPDGYWSADIDLDRFNAGDHVMRDVALVKKCTGSIAGRVVDEGGAPLAGASVKAFDFFDHGETTSDAEGRFSFPALLLGRNNAPTTYHVGVTTPGYDGPVVSTPFATCGDQREVTVVLQPTTTFSGAIEGHVYDEETGAPVAGIDVTLGSNCPCTKTDGDGHYRLDDINVGGSGDAVIETIVTAELTNAHDYWGSLVTGIEVHANRTTPLDLKILHKRTARIAGIVRDAVTHQPIADASVALETYPGVGTRTGPDGSYQLGSVGLGYRNAPQDVRLDVSVEDRPYWAAHATVTVRADETATSDFDLITICTDAAISGRVVDASTEKPIAGAVVSGGGGEVLTNTDGDYHLDHVRVGADNSPLEVKLTAIASGYYTQSKRITVFCGGRIVVDFGRPPGTGAIQGHVTNLLTGQPIVGVFVGSEFGDATKTDASGFYRFDHVPLGPNGADRTWDVTAAPAEFDPKTKSATVHANETSVLDFAFGAAQPVNRPPAASDGAATTPQETPVAVPLVASDPDGDSLSYTIVSGPSHGTLSGAGASRTYTPDAGYTGADSFTFRVNDGQLDSNVATFSLTVTPVNRAPVARDSSVETPKNVPVGTPLDASDPDGDALSVSIVDGPTHGVLSGTGIARTYTPERGYQGPDNFTFRVSDGKADSNLAKVSITVVDRAPVCRDVSLVTDQDTPVDGQPDCTDPDGDALTYRIAGQGSLGSASVVSAVLHYVPNAGVSGRDLFTYTAHDGALSSNIANANVTINARLTAKLVVIKHVVNDNGGTLAAGAFTLTIDGVTATGGNALAGAESPGVAKEVTPGAYAVREVEKTGYATTYSAGCSGAITAGETKTCTVTNDDRPAHLIVIKHVVNNDGGIATADQFALTIEGVAAVGGSSVSGAEAPGVTREVAAGTYRVTEVAPPPDPACLFFVRRLAHAAWSGCQGYAPSYSAGCSGAIALGETKTCTVTNDDFSPVRQKAYWKNHQARTTALLPVGLGGYAVDTYAKAVAVFDAMHCGSSTDSAKVVSCLAGLLLTVKLDVASGSDRCISATAGSADTFLAGVPYGGPASAVPTLTKARLKTANALKDALDAYLAAGACG